MPSQNEILGMPLSVTWFLPNLSHSSFIFIELILWLIYRCTVYSSCAVTCWQCPHRPHYVEQGLCICQASIQPKSNLVHVSFKIWRLVATLRISLPNFVQFKQYQGKSNFVYLRWLFKCCKWCGAEWWGAGLVASLGCQSSGARCRLAYGSADATATHCLLLQ